MSCHIGTRPRRKPRPRYRRSRQQGTRSRCRLLRLPPRGLSPLAPQASWSGPPNDPSLYPAERIASVFWPISDSGDSGRFPGHKPIFPLAYQLRRPKISSPEFTTHGPIRLTAKAHGLRRQERQERQDGNGARRVNGKPNGFCHRDTESTEDGDITSQRDGNVKDRRPRRRTSCRSPGLAVLVLLVSWW